ncbi:MAG: hypothetical protein JSS93_02630 [Bacteroidetes bacterium]|nr:hypothetical protein [Bacteroidota bacterium]
MNNLASGYNAQNISFLNLGYDNINNDIYYSTNFSFSSTSYQNLYNQLIGINLKSNAINIFKSFLENPEKLTTSIRMKLTSRSGAN